MKLLSATVDRGRQECVCGKLAIAFSDKQGILSSRFAPIYVLLSNDYNNEPMQIL